MVNYRFYHIEPNKPDFQQEVILICYLLPYALFIYIKPSTFKIPDIEQIKFNKNYFSFIIEWYYCKQTDTGQESCWQTWIRDLCILFQTWQFTFQVGLTIKMSLIAF